MTLNKRNFYGITTSTPIKLISHLFYYENNASTPSSIFPQQFTGESKKCRNNTLKQVVFHCSEIDRQREMNQDMRIIQKLIRIIIYIVS